MYQQHFSAMPETIAGRYDKADDIPTNRYPTAQGIVLERFINPTKFSFTYRVKFRML